MKKVYLLFALMLAAVNAFALPASWVQPSTTGNNAVIGFQQSGGYYINGREMAPGDGVAAFYARGAEEFCAGYLIWDGVSFGMAVVGDNDQTPIKDGYSVSENYIFRLWDNVLQVEVTSPTLQLFNGNNYYTVNGITIYNEFFGVNPNALPAPILSTPANGAVNVATVMPEFTWNASLGANQYYWQIAYDQEFYEIVAETDDISQTNISVAGLESNTTFYWRVKAQFDDIMESSWSAVWSFTTGGGQVQVPTLVSPLNNTAGTSPFVVFEWTPVENQQFYYMQIATNNTFTNIINEGVVFGNTFEQNLLQFNTQYFWRVKVNETEQWSETWSFTTMLDLVQPALISPLNQATGLNTTLSLVWSEVSSADEYEVRSSYDPNFFTYSYTNTIETFLPVSGLDYSTTYFWKVRAKRAIPGYGNNYGPWSETRSFTTMQGLAAPILTAPVNNAVEQGLSPILTWDNVIGRDFFNVIVSTTSDFTNILLSDDTSEEYFYLSGLEPNTTYYWKVQAVGYIPNYGLTNSPWSEVWSFTTQDLPLTAPLLVSPPNNTGSIATDPILFWSAVAGAETYLLQVSYTNDFSDPFYNYTVNGTQKDFSELNYSTQYFWRVAAIRGQEQSAWSEVWNFTTVPAPPAAPVLILPANGALNQLLAATFDWEDVAGVSSYQLYISTSQNFDVNLMSYTSVPSLATISGAGMTYGTVYYWKVRAYRSSDKTYSPWSETWSYTTDNNLLAPILVSPLNNAVNVGLNPAIDWQDVLSATGYSVQISTSPNFNENATSISCTPSNTIASGLAYNTLYYWRVKAYRAGDDLYGPWSETWSFTTMEQPSGDITTLNVEVLQQGLYNGTTQQLTAIVVELRSGTSLGSSTLYKRTAALLNTNGIAEAKFDDLVTGQYWLVIRASGYLPIASAQRITVTANAVNTYDFSRSAGSTNSPAMQKQIFNRYVMKSGDFDGNRRVQNTDTGIMKGNLGGNNSIIPAP